MQWLVLVLLVGVLAYTLWQITTEFAGLRRSGAVRGNHRFFGQAQPMGQSQVNYIQGWMTFRYVNQVFSLPAGYLQTELNISDSKYPNITINSLAKEQNKSAAAELLLVQQKIKNYFSPRPQTTANP